MFKIQKIWRLLTIAALLASALNLSLVPATPAYADSTAQTLPFSQDWSNTGLITVNDDWSGVPGITGYLGQNITTATGTDPQTLLTESAVAGDLTVLANQTVATSTSGDVAEFEITDSVVGFQGSGTADAPYILLSIDTTGKSSINISYNLRDLDGTADNAVQPVALQYRVGSSGNFTNVPSGYVADATSGPSLATLVTPVNVTLPGAVDNQTLVQIRIITANAVGSDEWVGIDDISVTGSVATPTLSIDDVTQAEGDASTSLFTFTVSLSPASASDVTFDIASADDTATIADSDYVANSATGVTILAGATTSTFDVTVNGDTNTEPTETFNVNVTSVASAGAVTLGDGLGIGTIANDDAVVPALSINDVAVAEGNAGTSVATFTVSLDIAAGVGGVTFNIATADDTATTADSDYVSNSALGVNIPEGSTSTTFDVTINGDTTSEPTETFFVNVTNPAGATLLDGVGLGTITNDDATPTYVIQGSGSATTMSGTQITEGVVVGDYEGDATTLSGFYIQDSTGDSNPATSDGLFVYNNNANNNVALGDLVRVTGTVAEYQGQTQITATSISVLSSGNTITSTDIVLPFASTAEQEQYEGMLVRVPQTLYVTEHFQLGRFGQIVMSGTSRLFQPTNIVLPGAPAIAMQAANNLNKIVVDDASQAQNPDPILFGRGGNPLSAANTLRGGDTLAGLTGVFTYTWGGNSASGNAYRIRPVNAMGGGVPNFVASNARPATPPVVGGSIKAVGMNVLNYFNSFTSCYPSGTVSDCRGADDATEFTRQSDKLVNAIIALNADVIGIAEMENDGYDASSAIQDLVNKLNAVAGAGTYAFINPDTANGANSMGTDAIKVGILYQPAKVTPVGITAVLNSTAFVNGGDVTARNRPSILQAFQNANGERFLLNVNHLKSKGSCPTAGTNPGNEDTGDGQSCWSLVRANAVNALLAWFATDPTGTGDPDILIVGDLNSYAKEDPIAAFEAAGYTDMVNHFGGASTYSYVYDGQWGYLDYALGSPSLLAQTTNADDWHINSDEPSVLDYNLEFKSVGQQASLYSPDAYRISDHDPVIVGLDLTANAPETQIDSHPTDPSNSVAGAFTFSSLDPTATFECSLDGAAFATCTSPFNFSGLSDGPHTFEARGIDSLGNTDATPASFTWTIDLVAPTVSSSLRTNPNPTAAPSVDFTVTFSEDVTGVDVADFSLTTGVGTSGASVTGVTGGPAVYTVSVDTGSGSGTLRLDVIASPSIQDLAANLLVGPYTGGEVYDINKTITVLGDFNGDGLVDIAVFRPSNGTWYIRGQGTYLFGMAGDTPVPADYNGDGKADIAVFRPSNNTWYVRGQGTYVFGAAGDIPVVGDYNGDGKAEIATFRPSNATWYIRGISSFAYGAAGDIPVPADYNEDGKAEIATFRPSNNTWYVHGQGTYVFGAAGDIPVPADYNGDGKAEIATFCSSTGTWYIKGLGSFIYGTAGDIPVPGNFTGDSKIEAAVFRPSNNTWYIKGLGPIVFGASGDIPASPQGAPGDMP